MSKSLQRSSKTSKPGNTDAQVLYIHPAKQGVGFVAQEGLGRPYGVIPVGVAALVNLLRENGIAVRGINFSLEKQLDDSFTLNRWLSAQRGVRVILIDMHWYEHTYGAISFAQVCKQIMPWARIIIGGLTASGYALDIIKQFSEVDFVICGDAEYPLLSLVQLLLKSGPRIDVEKLQDIPNLVYRQDDQVKINPLSYTATTKEIDDLNFVDLDFMDHAQEYAVHEYLVSDLGSARQALAGERPFAGRWLCTARGCRYNCSYCGGAKGAHKQLANRQGVIIRSPERIADDLQALQQLGIDQAAMSYDIAELGEDYWQTLFSEMKRREIQIGIYNEFFQMPSHDFVHAISETANMPHTCVALSPLSGNERVRRLNGKHYSNQAFFDILQVLAERQLYLYVYFSLNLPGETNETFKETLNIATQVYNLYPHRLLKILNTVHTIDPLAPMNLRPERYGIVSTMKSFDDFYKYCRDTQLLDPDSRVGKYRGYDFMEPELRSLKQMAAAWDAARNGREESWWPIPPSW